MSQFHNSTCIWERLEFRTPSSKYPWSRMWTIGSYGLLLLINTIRRVYLVLESGWTMNIERLNV
ncbi:hypothetical protein ARMSODRAFT_967420 [Armillaria solidipes]|uniref:Uncharacterized protein n=1 Tax=Armillaria solidipes TaxID=1076256 RepID=A0A2H3AVB5_9AGAR|nr:hypothetical protein ARMSODRAFT_967420 [Armillaria solidipes]